LLTIIVPLLYALAIWLARGYRRRTLMNVGIAIVFAGVLVFLARTLIVSQVTDSLVKTDSVRPAATAVISIATTMLSEIAGAFVVVGIPLIAAAWFAGPTRLAVRVGWPGGISPPGSLRSRRDSLPSPGSSHQLSVVGADHSPVGE
jgi:hypothetical protein